MLKDRLLILLLIFAQPHNSSCVIDAIYDAGEEIWKLYSMIDKMEFNTNSNFEELFIRKNELNEEIRKQLGVIDEQINELDEPMNFGTTRESLKPTSSSSILFRDLDIVEIFLQNIDKNYEKFHRYITGAMSYSDETFRNFVQELNLNIEAAREVLRKTLTDDEVLAGRKNLVTYIGDYATNQQTEMCNGPQMISSILVQLFRTVMVAELKSNIMLSIANIYRYMGDTGSWKHMNLISRMQFERQFGIYVRLFTSNLIKSDRSYLRACDPQNGTWTQNDSFYELEGTIQATMFRYLWPCKYSSCNDIWSKKNQQCDVGYHNKRSVCANDLVECTYLKAVEACQLKSGPYKFQYVNSTELGFLGKNSECPKNNGQIIRDGTFWTVAHKVCACNCYANDNKISLAIIESNTERNMVIIGIRFFRQNRILYIQPREGKLSNDGRIIRHTEKWVPIPKYIEESDIHPVDRMNRVFFFDDLRLPLGYVLTGVKFNKVSRENVEGFAIGISGSSFDYSSGKIDDIPLKISKQVLNETAGTPLSFTPLSSVDTKLTHIVSSKSIKYVSLQRSTLKEDFGQLTLPLFDAVPIRSNPPSPLGGIGIFHKGVEGYAGFISLRAFGINYAYYFLHFESHHLKDGIVKFNHSYYH